MVVKSVVVQSNLDSLSDYSLQLNRWLLKSIGAWPKSPATPKMEKVLSFVLSLTCYFFILIGVIPCILHLIFEEEDLRSKLTVAGPLSHWLFGCIGYTLLLVHAKEIKWCEQQVKNDWRATTRPEMQRKMLRNAKFGRFVVAFCAAFLQGAIQFHNIVRTFTTQIVVVGNETRIIRGLPLAVYRKLIQFDTSPTYEIIMATQLVSAFFVNCTFVGAFSLATVFTIHVSDQMDVLALWITEIVDQGTSNDKRINLTEMSAVVQKHLNILSFISRIEAIMNEICFMELFKCTLSICLLGYYILMEWADQDFRSMTSYVLILGSMTFNIFMLCFIGEVITEQCNKVGEAVYTSKWYYLHKKDVFNLMMIISRSCKETKITAGKIIHLSFYTFASVIKTAFAYLNMLLQTV